MKKIIPTVLFLTFLLGACRTLQVRDFHTNKSLPTHLPSLGLLVHERSFLEAFDHSYDREVLLLNATGPGPDPWTAYELTDQALEDVFHVLGNELGDNISQSAASHFGHARFKLLFYKRRNVGWGWTLASYSTLFIPNLFGMPARTHRVEMELQMEIADAQGKILAQYTAPGEGKAQVAAYHGYESNTATRKANLLALQHAMAKIKSKLEGDVPALTAQLEAAGTLYQLDGK